MGAAVEDLGAAALPGAGKTMKTLAEAFLTNEEQQQITRYVQQAESVTSGEIVPMIVSSSHDYPLTPVIGAALIALPAGLIGSRMVGGWFWMTPDPVWLFIACFLAAFVVCHEFIKRSPRLLRLFLSQRRAEKEVEQAATMAFFSERLYKTRDENGILLYISVLEQRVWVLGDRGINARVDPQRWQEIVALVTDGIKRGQQCIAICTAITRIGDMLRDSFPIADDDKNELHNLIIR